MIYTHNKTRAFTLIDILVSVSIISFLSSIVMFNVTEGRTKAQDTQMKMESAQVATAIELFKIDNEGKTPISVQAEYFDDFNIKPGEMYQEGTPQYETVMTKLVEGGYISEIPTSSEGDSYAYGETPDGTQAMFVAELSSESNINNNTENNSCDFVEPTPQVIKKVSQKCLRGRISPMIPAPLFAYCKYIQPQFSNEDLQGPTYTITLTSPAGWDCSGVPLDSLNCNEWSPGTLEEACTTQGHTWEFDDDVIVDMNTYICIEPDQSKGYMCVGDYYNPPPCESAAPIEGYTCTDIDAEIYELCPIDQGGGGQDTGGSGNLCDGSTLSDYCTCI